MRNSSSSRKKLNSGYSIIELTLALAVIGSGIAVGIQLHNYSQAKSQGETLATLMSDVNSGVGSYISTHYPELMALPDACSQTNFRIGVVLDTSPVVPDFDKCRLTLKNGTTVTNGMQPTLAELSSLGYLTAGLNDSVPWAGSAVVVGSVDGTGNTQLMPARFAVLVEKFDLPGTCDKFLMVDGADNSGKSFWAQDVKLSIGSSYELSYWVAGNAGVQLQGRLDGTNIGAAETPPAGGPWSQVSRTFVAVKEGTRISLAALSVAGTENDFAIDDISLRLIDGTSSSPTGPNLVTGGDFNSGSGGFVSDYLLQPQISAPGTAAIVSAPLAASRLGISAGRGNCTPRTLRSLVFNLQPYDSGPWLGALRLNWAAHMAGPDALLSTADNTNRGELLEAGGSLSGWRNPLRSALAPVSQGLPYVFALRNGYGSHRTGYRQQNLNRYSRRDAITVAATADWDFANRSIRQVDSFEVKGQLRTSNIKLSDKLNVSNITTLDAVVTSPIGVPTLHLRRDGQVVAASAAISESVLANNWVVTGSAETKTLNISNTASASRFVVGEKLYLGPAKTRGSNCDSTSETLARDQSPDYSKGEGMLQCAQFSNKWVVWRGPQGEAGPSAP